MRASITITGTATATAPADLCDLQVSVETRAGDVGSALQANNNATAGLFAILAEAGVAEHDRFTGELGVHRQEPYQGGPSEVTYIVTNGLRIRIRRLDQLGEVVAAAQHAVGDAFRLHGLSFGTDNLTHLRQASLEAAIDDARHLANVAAVRSGRVLAEVLRIRVHPDGNESIVPRHGLMRETAMASPVPVAAGLTQVTTSVELKFALT